MQEDAILGDLGITLEALPAYLAREPACTPGAGPSRGTLFNMFLILEGYSTSGSQNSPSLAKGKEVSLASGDNHFVYFASNASRSLEISQATFPSITFPLCSFCMSIRT